MARYQRDGTLDPTFGEGGKVVTRYGGANARAVALQPNGRILVAGTNTHWLALARYRPDGRLDRSFGGDGRVGVVYGILPLAVALQRDGRIIVAGGFDYDRIGLVRFHDNGRLDRSFGRDGIVRRKVDGVEQAANGLILQPDGRVVVTGYSGPHEYGDPTVFRFIMIRCLPDGRLDQTRQSREGRHVLRRCSIRTWRRG